MNRSHSMPKLQRPSSRASDISGRPATVGSCKQSASRLESLSESLSMMPAPVRLEFQRYSTPQTGPMGRSNVKLVSKHFKFRTYVEGLENRSVTLAQLVQIGSFAVRQCYNWTISAGALNFYDVHEWIVRPVTREHNTSMMEHLADQRLAPTWFVSHYWGDHIQKFLDCVRQHLAVRGLSARTGYWVFAFASRHHDPVPDAALTLTASLPYRVLEASGFRILMIMGASPEAHAFFTRTWCTFECALCLDCPTLAVDVAAFGLDVEILTSGLTTSETCANKYYPGSGVSAKNQREASFPLEVVREALAFNITKTHASDEAEQQHLMSSFAQMAYGQAEDESDGWYQMSRRLRSFLLLIFWQHLLVQASHDKEHMSLLNDAAKAIQGDWWRKELRLSLAGCDFTNGEILAMALQSLPRSLEILKLDLQFTGLDDASLHPAAKELPEGLQHLVLDITGCDVSDKGVLTFLKKLDPELAEVTVKLQNTKVSKGLLALSKDGPTALQKWATLSHSERADVLSAKLEIIERKKNPSVAPTPSHVSKKVALQNLLNLAPAKIAANVLEQVKSDLAALEKSTPKTS